MAKRPATPPPAAESQPAPGTAASQASPQRSSAHKALRRAPARTTAVQTTALDPEVIEKPQRLDRNFTNNVLDFSRFKEDEQLCRDLVIYFCLTLQEPSLLNMGRLDPVDFAKKMRYHRNHLYNRHPNPAHVSTHGESADAAEYTYDNVLENALYRLSTEKLHFTTPARIYKGKRYTTLQTVEILTSLTHVVDAKNRNKLYYLYDYNPDLIGNLSGFFATFNLEVYNRLRQCNLQQLYLHMEGLRTQMRQEQRVMEEMNFTLLARLTGKDDVKEPKRRKYEIGKMLDRLVKETGWQMEYRFVPKGTQRYAYTLQVQFADVQQLSDGQRRQLWHGVFIETFERGLIDIFRARYLPDLGEVEPDAAAFAQWKRSNEDLRAKYDCYLGAQQSVYHNEVKPRDPRSIEGFYELMGVYPPWQEYPAQG